MPSSADTASAPVFFLRITMPRTNSCEMVPTTNAQKPKQITAAHDDWIPAAKHSPTATAKAAPGNANW